jgi:hypothetical protein
VFVDWRDPGGRGVGSGGWGLCRGSRRRLGAGGRNEVEAEENNEVVAAQ